MKFDELLLFTVYLVVYFTLHSVLAHQHVKNYLYGPWLSKTNYRLFYNLVAILLLLPGLWMYASIPSVLLFDMDYLSYWGIGFALSGFIFLFLSLKQYNLSEFSGLEQLQANSLQKSASLQTSGLNAIVRHPLYTSSLLILWGWLLYRQTDIVLVIALVSTGYIYVGTKLEEQKLVQEFGAAYRSYQQRVGMLLPKF